jgi:drug/metabolite transporter (DMT)-like permease
MKPSQPAAYTWMLASAAAFTVMGGLTHTLRSECDWALTAFCRAALALAFALWIGKRAGAAFAFWRPRSLWLRSLAGSCSLVLTFYALPRLPMGHTLTLTNMAPMWIALLSWPMLGRRPTFATWIAVALSLAGVRLMHPPEADVDQLAGWAAFASSLTTGVAMMGLHRVRHLDAWAIVAHFSGVAAVFACAAFLMGVVGRTPQLPQSAWAVGALLGVGVFATLGQWCMTRAYAVGQPAQVAVVGLTQVVFGFGLDVLVWRRAFDATTLLGAALVLAPTAWLMTVGRPRAAIHQDPSGVTNV